MISILLACSCTSKSHKPKPWEIQKIDVLSKPDSIIYSLSDIATDIQYIPLQTPITFKFADIYKMLTLKHKIYINTGFNLLCYDDSGRFLYSLFQNSKESPGFIYDFDISPVQETIAVLYYRKILLFEKKAGSLVFTKLIKLKKPSPCRISFVSKTNNILLSVNPIKGTEKYLSLIINFDGDTLQLRKNHTKYFLPSMPIFETGKIQYKSGNSVYFKEQNNDTIFYINEKSEITPSYILDLKGQTLLNWVKGSGEYKYDRKKPYLIIEDIHDVPKFILYTYSQHFSNASWTLHHRILYNKITRRKLHLNLNEGLKDDLSGGPDFSPLFLSSDRYYSWAAISDLKKFIDSEDFNTCKVLNVERKAYLKNMTDSLRDEDIALIVVSLKQ